MDNFLLTVFNGATYGLLIFLLAAGLTLVFSMLGVLNFAHASFYMLGAYAGYTVTGVLGLGFGWGLVIAPVACALVGLAVQRWGLRHVIPYGILAQLLFTFALEMLLEELVILVWGKQPVAYAVPASLDFALFSIGGVEYSAYRMFVFASALVLLAVLYAALTRTSVGLVIRASLSRPDVVTTLGHDLPSLQAGVFASGCALAGLAGALAGNLLGTEPGMARQLGSLLLIVIVVGGLGSLAGSFVASMLIGLLQTFAITTSASWADLLPGTAGDTLSVLSEPVARLAPLLPYFLMMMILLFRPRGLLGRRDV